MTIKQMIRTSGALAVACALGVAAGCGDDARG